MVGPGEVGRAGASGHGEGELAVLAAVAAAAAPSLVKWEEGMVTVLPKN